MPASPEPAHGQGVKSVSVCREAASETLVAFARKKFRPPLSSVGHVERCLNEGLIHVNNAVQISHVWRLQVGDTVSLVASDEDLMRLRFKSALLPLIHDESPAFVVLLKPPGMPLDGSQPDTVEKALAPSLSRAGFSDAVVSEAACVSCVGRGMEGPALVALDKRCASNILECAKRGELRYNFHCIVHGAPPSVLSGLPGYLTSSVACTTSSTGGTLTSLDVKMSTNGVGLKRALYNAGSPVLGKGALTRSSKGSSVKGTYLSCTLLEVPRPAVCPPGVQEARVVHVSIPLSSKYASLLSREERFFAAKGSLLSERASVSMEMKAKFNEMLEQSGNSSFPELYSRRDACFVSFRGLPMFANRNAMTPRRNSEGLVSVVSNFSRDLYRASSCSPNVDGAGPVCSSKLSKCSDGMRFLDLGTGSGALLIAVLRECMDPAATGVGLDISEDALDVARINVSAHGLKTRAKLVQGRFGSLDCLTNSTFRPFDVILCNPPYLTAQEMEDIDARLDEPKLALVADDISQEELQSSSGKALACYEELAKGFGNCPQLLRQSGLLVIEVGGKRHYEDVLRLFQIHANLVLDRIELDANGFHRVLVLQHC